MGKRCACERLFRRLEEDVRLRTLPMAAQMLWLKLMRLALATDDGVLRLGSDFGFLTAVSLAVSHAETEVETALAALERRGLAERGADGASLRLPDAVEGAERAKAARLNGLRGGRPRKGETAEAAAARKQGSLMLPVAGGLGETQETEQKPRDESSRAASLASSEEKGAAAAGAGEGWVALGMELAAMAGMDSARGQWNLQPVRGWLASGATPAMLREAVRRVSERPRYTPPGSLQYFAKAVAEVMAEGQPKPLDTGAEARVAARSAAFAAWQASGCMGPPPGLAA